MVETRTHQAGAYALGCFGHPTVALIKGYPVRSGAMRVLVAGDFHGPKGLEVADTMAQARGCDAILQVGDFWAYDVGVETPTWFVPGNHEKWERVQTRDFASGIRMLEDYETVEMGGVVVGSVGRIQKSEAHDRLMWRGWWIGEGPEVWLEEDEEAVEALASADVLVFHDKPHFELADEDFLCRVVRRVEPALVLHGHMHRFEVTKPVEGTTVVSLPPCDLGGAVIENERGETVGPSEETFVLDMKERTLWNAKHGRLEW